MAFTLEAGSSSFPLYLGFLTHKVYGVTACDYGYVSIPRAVTPVLQPVGDFQWHFTNTSNGPTILQK